MTEIGCSQCRKQNTMMVNTQRDCTGRTNPFTNNQPGKDGGMLFVETL